MFHRHIWKITNRKALPSVLQQLKEMGASKVSSGNSTPKQMRHQDVIVSYQCESCGSEKVVRI